MSDETPNWPTGGRVEPSGDIRHAAAQIRQAYNAFRDQGFTDAQTLTLCAGMLGAKITPPGESP